ARRDALCDVERDAALRRRRCGPGTRARAQRRTRGHQRWWRRCPASAGSRRTADDGERSDEAVSGLRELADRAAAVLRRRWWSGIARDTPGRVPGRHVDDLDAERVDGWIRRFRSAVSIVRLGAAHVSRERVGSLLRSRRVVLGTVARKAAVPAQGRDRAGP